MKPSNIVLLSIPCVLGFFAYLHGILGAVFARASEHQFEAFFHRAAGVLTLFTALAVGFAFFLWEENK